MITCGSPKSVWRRNNRSGDGLCILLTRSCQRNDRVRFDPGPGLRITGTLIEWKEEGLAAIEVDNEDVGLRQMKIKHPIGMDSVTLPEVKRIMYVPVKR